MKLTLQYKYPYLYEGEWYFFDGIWFSTDYPDQYLFLNKKNNEIVFFRKRDLLHFRLIASKYDLKPDEVDLTIPTR